jgi:hypothetical protein
VRGFVMNRWPAHRLGRPSCRSIVDGRAAMRSLVVNRKLAVGLVMLRRNKTLSLLSLRLGRTVITRRERGAVRRLTARTP